jgi:hypothetical protein
MLQGLLHGRRMLPTPIVVIIYELGDHETFITIMREQGRNEVVLELCLLMITFQTTYM